MRSWQNGERPLIAMATGAGKTTVMAELIRNVTDPRAGANRALLIGHTDEIIHQIYERVINQMGGANNVGLIIGGKETLDTQVIVSTRQSLHPKRMKRLLEFDHFDYLIIDESHHAFINNSYGAIIDACQSANPHLKLVGFTATPQRADRKALESIWSTIAYEWLIPEGILSGYLVPAQRLRVATKVDLSSIQSAHGDYQQGKMLSALKTENWLDLSLKAFADHVAGSERQTLAFMPSVQMSKDFAHGLGLAGVKVAHIDGTTPKDERRAVLRDYARGAINVISNCFVLVEGFDAPATSCIFLARPTRSATLFTQIIGRGLRPYPDKRDCLIVDMTVLDTRALERGTLLGDMLTCHECLVEFWKGLTVCPHCGADVLIAEHEPSESLPGDEMEIGTGLIVSYENLFEHAFAAWHQGAEGFFSCTAGFDEGAMIIVPPLEDNYYRLSFIPKQRIAPVEFLIQNEDLAALMLDADKIIIQRARTVADKTAHWRDTAATLPQLDLMARLNIAYPQDVSKGLASQIITHHLAVKRLTQEGAFDESRNVWQL